MKKAISNNEQTVKAEKKVIHLKDDVTGNKLKRKATNEAKKQATKEAADDKRKLSTHYKDLTQFASKFVVKLSDETGKEITAEQIKALKYSDFLPFLTEREEYSNSVNGWTFPRLLNVVTRYYRGEAKNQVKESMANLTEIE